jgi:hypothetical protein
MKRNLCSRAIISIFIIAASLASAACLSSGYSVPSVVDLGRGNALIAVNHSDKNSSIYHYRSGKAEFEYDLKSGEKIRWIQESGQVVVVLAELGVLYVYPRGKNSTLKIEPPDGQRKVLCAHFDAQKRVLYVSYESGAGSGISVYEFDESYDTYKTSLMTTKNSKLRADYVHQIVSDTRGALWIRYSAALELGVSRIKSDGKWNHFDLSNSNIGSDKVFIVRPEPAGYGLPGENIWFVTGSGLSTLKYLDNKEEWVFYGKKNSATDRLTMAMGIQSWFTDAILNIQDIAVTADSLIIADRGALYHFDGEKIDRYIPKRVGGIEDMRIVGLSMKGADIVVRISPYPNVDRILRYILIFDLNNKNWTELKVWDFNSEYPSDVWFLDTREPVEPEKIQLPAKTEGSAGAEISNQGSEVLPEAETDSKNLPGELTGKIEVKSADPAPEPEIPADKEKTPADNEEAIAGNKVVPAEDYIILSYPVRPSRFGVFIRETGEIRLIEPEFPENK